MSSEKKLITVFGATGLAGGSVVNYLLEDGTFAVRGVTRSASSDKAKALTKRGVEIVEADMDKPETLVAAIKGSYGVLGMTDFWTLLPGTGFDILKTEAEEEQQGRRIVDAAKAAGVDHFVFLSLPDGDCPHFRGKHRVEKYLSASGLGYTNVVTAMYFENLTTFDFFMFTPDGKGSGTVTVPFPADKAMSCYSGDQTGGWVLQAFKKPEQWKGKDIRVIGEYLTPRKMAAVLSAAIGKPVPIKEMSLEDFFAFGNSKPTDPQGIVAYELHLMLRDMVQNGQPEHGGGFYDEAAAAEVYPGVQNFEAWVRENERAQKLLASLAAQA
ncbi:NAD(P)-binding protein [Auriculariales sp. MPI-PUGE-AT-0066]|nr:NAD(P)-binding protein [Auriculariales sp. MPI-PUGE-AT-0066]